MALQLQPVRAIRALGFILLVIGALFWAYWVYTAGFGSYRSVEPYVVIAALMIGSLTLKVAGNRAERQPWWLTLTPGWVTFFVLLSALYNFLVAIVEIPIIPAYTVLIAGFGALLLASVTAELLSGAGSNSDPEAAPSDMAEAPSLDESADTTDELTQDSDLSPDSDDPNPILNELLGPVPDEDGSWW